MNIKPPRFTPAMAVAILAIVIALSSSATAALMINGKQIKDNSVSGKDIKNKSVTGKDLKKKSVGAKHLKANAVRSQHVKDGSLTSADVKDRSLTGSDIQEGSLSSTEIKDGSLTSTDIKDGTITEKQVSTSLLQSIISGGGGVAGFEVVSASTNVGLLSSRAVSANCPAGKVALSANGFFTGPVAVAPPELRRDGSAGFSANGAFLDAVTGALGGTLTLQVACINAG